MSSSPSLRYAAIVACAAFAVSAAPVAVADDELPPPPPPVDLPEYPTDGPCGYTPVEDEPYVVFKGMPADPDPTPTDGKVAFELVTSQGPIPMVMDRAQAPCTVQSMEHLVREGYYDNTVCHRLTAYSTLKVLQCGDPFAASVGSPGYRYKDELPTGLPKWEGHKDPTREVYPRGTLAMANAGPDTNGSQFFLVYEDSALPPNYSIFGCVHPVGMETLDGIVENGISPDSERASDGTPAREVRVESAWVGADMGASCWS